MGKPTIRSSEAAGFRFDRVEGPLGHLLLVASADGLRAALWNREPEAGWAREPSHPVLTAARRQFAEYFARKRMKFDLPLAPRGTPFQLRAWEALRRIPYGRTISYQEQALALGGANLARAVGAANGANPISIIVPCHRVVGKNGNLTGFLYGTEAKRFLLDLEAP